jgi:hypothetical protein
MSEPMYGRIRFGGKLKEELIPDLLEAMNECIWNNHTEEDMENDVDACKTKPGVLEYSEGEANYGQFESLEDFCTEHGLTFNAYRSGNYDCIPETRSYNGDTKEEYNTACDTSESPVMESFQVLKLLDTIQEFTDDPKKIPLNLNSKDWRVKEVAKHLSKADHNKPLILLKEILTYTYREPIEVPALEIIS